MSKWAYKWLLNTNRIYINYEKIELWMKDVQRWNVVFMFSVGKNMEHIQNLIGLNNIHEYFVHVETYILGP